MSSKRKTASTLIRQATTDRSRPGARVSNVGASSMNRSRLEDLTGVLFEGEVDNELIESISRCAWLDVESPDIVTLLCEIKKSVAVGRDSTLISLSSSSRNPEDVYWLLPSMWMHDERFSQNVQEEFSVEGSIKTDKVCDKCKQQWWYVTITRPTSADEAEVVHEQCATCKPKT